MGRTSQVHCDGTPEFLAREVHREAHPPPGPPNAPKSPITWEPSDRLPAVGDRVRVWPGSRDGRSYLATALTGVVTSDNGFFGGQPMVRVEKDSGGTDYITPSHVEVLADDPELDQRIDELHGAGAAAAIDAALSEGVIFSDAARVSSPRQRGCSPVPTAAAIPPIASQSHESDLVQMSRAFSLWLNSTYPPNLDPEAHMRRRATKVCEEAGEVHEAVGAYWQENPRKPAGPLSDVLKELADCAGSALGAIEDLTGHEGRSLDIVVERVRFVCERAGVDWEVR